MNAEQHKKEIQKSLKNKTILLATWGCLVSTSQECRDWQPIFRKIFKELFVFSFKNEFYYNGIESLNKKFLELIKTEKPDYLLACPAYYELYPETLIQIKKINPKMKTIIWFGDDEFRFDDFSRYYGIFFDYILTVKKEMDVYHADNLMNAQFMIGVNPKYHCELKIPKIYDVTFIGTPVADRYDYIKFLKENGVNIALFGGDWHDYADLQNIYHGFLEPDDFIKVINQSKINLNFSKTFFNLSQMKGRPIEMLACNAFVLNEYTNRTIDYLVNKKEINFSSKEELLKKIKYYLNHREEREKFAKEGQEHILKNYVWEDLFEKYFEKIEAEPVKPFNLPEIKKKIFKITEKEINLPLIRLKTLLKDFDYVCFAKSPYTPLPHKEYFQSYSLFISDKQISICDYFLSNHNLGDYLNLLSKKAFNTLSPEKFFKIFHINQIAANKKFFFENFKIFQQLFNNNPESAIKNNLLTNDKIVFISIPLVRVNMINTIDFKEMKPVMKTPFFDKLFAMVHQKKLTNPYIIKLFFLSYPGKKFVYQYLKERIFSKSSWEALKYFTPYVKK